MHKTIADDVNLWGYGVIRSCFNKNSILVLSDALTDIFEEFAISKHGQAQSRFWDKELAAASKDQLSGMLRLSSIDEYLDISSLKCLLGASDDIVFSTFGLSYTRVSVNAFYKAAFCTHETPWHQDPAYSSISDIIDAITLWIPLTALDDNSSTLEFIVGSHTSRRLRKHDHISGIDSALECPIHDDDEVARPKVATGDCVVHKSYVIHRATANMSRQHRIALMLVYRNGIVNRKA